MPWISFFSDLSSSLCIPRTSALRLGLLILPTDCLSSCSIARCNLLILIISSPVSLVPSQSGYTFTRYLHSQLYLVSHLCTDHSLRAFAYINPVNPVELGFKPDLVES